MVFGDDEARKYLGAPPSKPPYAPASGKTTQGRASERCLARGARPGGSVFACLAHCPGGSVFACLAHLEARSQVSYQTCTCLDSNLLEGGGCWSLGAANTLPRAQARYD